MEIIEMKHNIPGWAKRKVDLKHHSFADVHQLHLQGRSQIQLPDRKVLKEWARTHGWPVPWFGFKKAFITKLFESHETFTLALEESGIIMHIPIEQHTVTVEYVKDFDRLYKKHTHISWRALVSGLREIRRLVEAGVEVNIEGTETVMHTWQDFYTWAHGRYSLLEEGFDSWIGDDDT